MSITAGTRFGPYEIVAALGAGGMGEVYRARDTRLDRAVALKVLPQTFASDPSFLDRFEREARAISSLNHPNICSLYDVGNHDGTRYLVMELLDGETLAARLARGPLPLDEALRYAVQTADALSRAHRQGIVHRDLKPGNVMLTKHGAKLLDFGLARVDAPMPGASGVTRLAGTQDQPLTAAGTILGTFQYMAPEQLEGREADARTDIFAFGALLYEMITGRKAFSGATQASLIASIMSGVPPAISTVQPMTPPALDRVVRLCLAKDPEDRWQTAQDLAAELKWIAEGGSQVSAPVADVSRRRSREWLAWAAAAVCGLAAVAALARVQMLPTPDGREPTRFAIPPPKGVVLSWPRISPDGRIVAFVGESQGVKSIWIRHLGSLDPVRLPGTEGVQRPFWSPDSTYLAYFADGRLKKIAVSGGSPQLIAEDVGGDDGAWSAAGVILFDGDGPSIRRVPDSGGVPTVAMTPVESDKEVDVSWPFFLPDGRHYLFLANAGNGGTRRLKVASIDSETSTFLANVESRIEYSVGHVFYVGQQTLMARPFSPNTLSFTGDQFPITDRMQTQGRRADFSLSRTGDLAFMVDPQEPLSRLIWVDRAGRELANVGARALYRELALSPDGTRLAVSIDSGTKGTDYDIWVIDLKRGAMSRLTFSDGREGWLTWSPDSHALAYLVNRGGSLSVYRKAASGAGAEELLYADKDKLTVPVDWSPDGKLLSVESLPIGPFGLGNGDLGTISATSSGTATPFIETAKRAGHGRFSPDGRWIVYASDEARRSEIYVQSFPPGAGKWQISTDGGEWPMWSGDGKEIFYSLRDTLYAVPVRINGGAVDAAAPVKLFQRALNRAGTGPRGRWVVSRDGQRFLLNVPVDDDDRAVEVVLDGASGLKTPK